MKKQKDDKQRKRKREKESEVIIKHVYFPKIRDEIHHHLSR
jgi:hypothetical protein